MTYACGKCMSLGDAGPCDEHYYRSSQAAVAAARAEAHGVWCECAGAEEARRERDEALVAAQGAERRGYEQCQRDVVAWLMAEATQRRFKLPTGIAGAIRMGEHVGAAGANGT